MATVEFTLHIKCMLSSCENTEPEEESKAQNIETLSYLFIKRVFVLLYNCSMSNIKISATSQVTEIKLMLQEYMSWLPRLPSQTGPDEQDLSVRKAGLESRWTWKSGMNLGRSQGPGRWASRQGVGPPLELAPLSPLWPRNSPEFFSSFWVISSLWLHWHLYLVTPHEPRWVCHRHFQWHVWNWM